MSVRGRKETMSKRIRLVLAGVAALGTAAIIHGAVAGHDSAGPTLRPEAAKNCAAGFVAEGADAPCLPVSKPEGNAIETQKEMLQRAMRSTAPFDTVAP